MIKMRHKTTNTKTIIAAGCSVVLVGAGIAAIATSCSNNDKTTKSSAINIEGGYNRQAAEEGIVLLKNDNHVLPLQSKAKISVFGMTQVNYFYGGEGSGSIGNTFYRTNVLDGLRRNPDVNLNEALAQHYESKASNYKRDGHANKEINPVIDDGTN
jgi:beta-glucosidase-like glycosyl hydrolase